MPGSCAKLRAGCGLHAWDCRRWTALGEAAALVAVDARPATIPGVPLTDPDTALLAQTLRTWATERRGHRGETTTVHLTSGQAQCAPQAVTLAGLQVKSLTRIALVTAAGRDYGEFHLLAAVRGADCARAFAGAAEALDMELRTHGSADGLPARDLQHALTGRRDLDAAVLLHKRAARRLESGTFGSDVTATGRTELLAVLLMDATPGCRAELVADPRRLLKNLTSALQATPDLVRAAQLLQSGSS